MPWSHKAAGPKAKRQNEIIASIIFKKHIRSHLDIN